METKTFNQMTRAITKLQNERESYEPDSVQWKILNAQIAGIFWAQNVEFQEWAWLGLPKGDE